MMCSFELLDSAMPEAGQDWGKASEALISGAKLERMQTKLSNQKNQYLK